MGKRSSLLRLFKRTSISLGHFLAWNFVIFLVCVFAILDYGDKISDWFVDYHYAHIEKPGIGTIPPTFTAFPSGPSVAAVIGGKGQGLGCSVPSFASFAFEKPERVEAPLELRFRQACVMHDLCYRHGLATYGYTQTDCDYMLQEQAYQACASLLRPPNDVCRRAAKKVLLGVRIGGPGSFQGAQSSTYFEYDPFPLRASEFVYARALLSPNSGKETLVTFQAKQPGLAASEAGRPPLPVWLPQRYYMSSPQHVIDADGFSRLVWPMRRDAESTTSCLVKRGLLNLYTEPTRDNGLFLCNTPDTQSLVDLRTTSPLMVPRPGAKIVAAGVTHLGPASKPTDTAAILDLKSLDIKWKDLGSDGPKNFYRFLQSAFLIGQFTSNSGGKDVLLFRRGRAGGAGYRDFADAVIVPSPDLDSDSEFLLKASNEAQKRKTVSFPNLAIPEEAEPLVTLPLAGTDGLLGITINGCAGWADCMLRRINEWTGAARPKICSSDGACLISVGLDGSKPREIPILAGNQRFVSISPSLVTRPMVIGHNERDQKTEVFVSRTQTLESQCSEGGAKPQNCRDKVRLEVMALTAKGSANSVTLHFDRGAVCDVSRLLAVSGFRSCRTSSFGKASRDMHWANRLRGGQGIVGDFSGTPEFDFALIDACNPSDPIILETVNTSDGRITLDKQPGSNLDVTCSPLDSAAAAQLLTIQAD